MLHIKDYAMAWLVDMTTSVSGLSKTVLGLSFSAFNLW